VDPVEVSPIEPRRRVETDHDCVLSKQEVGARRVWAPVPAVAPTVTAGGGGSHLQRGSSSEANRAIGFLSPRRLADDEETPVMPCMRTGSVGDERFFGNATSTLGRRRPPMFGVRHGAESQAWWGGSDDIRGVRIDCTRVRTVRPGLVCPIRVGPASIIASPSPLVHLRQPGCCPPAFQHACPGQPRPELIDTCGGLESSLHKSGGWTRPRVRARARSGDHQDGGDRHRLPRRPRPRGVGRGRGQQRERDPSGPSSSAGWSPRSDGCCRARDGNAAGSTPSAYLLAVAQHQLRGMVSAAKSTIFAEPDGDAARQQLRDVVDKLSGSEPLQAMEPTCSPIPPSRRCTGPRSGPTTPIERLNRELKRRTDVVQIFPDPSP
jgi:hypothetical protein